MKDSKFIELLNLYVDHQISPAEAEQLEAEVRSSPERLRVYREYCQMQKACNVIAETFRTEAPVAAPQIATMPPRRASAGAWSYVGGFVAVAACVAVVLSFGSRKEPAVNAPVLAQSVQPKPAVTAPAVAAARTALQPVLGPRLLTVREPSVDATELAAMDRAAFGEWMNSVQLTSLPGTPAEELQFDAHATLQPESRNLHSRRPIQGKVEWTAFTFQK